MKKYTKKQIEEAFLKWETQCRLQPQTMASEKEMKEMSVEQLAKESLRALLEFMD